MELTDTQISSLKEWMLAKLEVVAEADAEVLADYVFQILKSTPTIEEVRKSCVGELGGFLNDHTASFVEELLLKLTPTGPKPKSSVMPCSSDNAPCMPPLPPSVQKRSSSVIRNPLPITQARSALRNAPPLSYTAPDHRKRKFAPEYVQEDQNYIGNHRVTKRGRVANGPHRSWRGNPTATSTNVQPVGLGLGVMPMEFPRPPTPPPGMPAFSPNNPAASFAAMFPYMATVMMNAQTSLKKERCQYFDEHGYCMRGETCPYSHIKQKPDEETPYKTGGCTSDAEASGKPSRKMAAYPCRLPNTPLTKDDEPRLSSDCTIYVDHIPGKNFDWGQIMDQFRQFGSIVKVKMSGTSSASVRFSNAAAAARAIESPKAVLDSRQIVVTSTSSSDHKSSYVPEDPGLSTSPEGLSSTPEEHPEPLTPADDIEIDIEAVRVEQAIKQEEHKARQAVLKKTENESARIARLSAEVGAKLEAERAKLLEKTGGYSILAEITRDQEKKANQKDSDYQLEQTAAEYGVPLEVMNVATSERASRRGSSALSESPALSSISEIICKFYPECTKTPCLFKHVEGASSRALCKFRPNCTNPACTFLHPSGRLGSQIQCKFLSNCTNPACTYLHPGVRHGSQAICGYHPNCKNVCTITHPPVKALDIECKYFPNCTNPDCIFKHPNGSRTGAIKRAYNRPKSLLITGVTASINNMTEGMNMVRVAVLGIHPFESLEPQSVHDESVGEDDAHDGLVVTFAQRWQAEEVQKRLTMVGGVGRVKCTWYSGPIDPRVMGTPRTELEIESDDDGERGDSNGDISIMDDVAVKEEDLDVAGEDTWEANIS